MDSKLTSQILDDLEKSVEGIGAVSLPREDVRALIAAARTQIAISALCEALRTNETLNIVLERDEEGGPWWNAWVDGHEPVMVGDCQGDAVETVAEADESDVTLTIQSLTDELVKAHVEDQG